MHRRDKNAAVEQSPVPLIRASATLQLLPVEFRWEFTRRHPAYLTSWKLAHRFHTGQLQGPLETLFGQAAVMTLAAIGVSGDPLSPSASHNELQFGQLGTAWKDGAVAPVSYRGMAGDLLTSLPPDTRRTLGELLIASADAAEVENRFGFILRLMTWPDKSLDAIPRRPIIGVNVQSPQRAIVEAVESLVTQWKQAAGVDEVRRRDDVLPLYLRAWDLHEGWHGDHYEIEREKSFRDMARELHIPPRTAVSRYHTAFEIITGEKYSFANWVNTFSAIKLVQFSGIKSLRRHKLPGTKRQRGSRRPVPVSAIEKPKPGKAGILELQRSSENAMEAVELFIDVTSLIEKGWSDEKIQAEMQFKDTAAGSELIQYLRRRHENSEPQVQSTQ